MKFIVAFAALVAVTCADLPRPAPLPTIVHPITVGPIEIGEGFVPPSDFEPVFIDFDQIPVLVEGEIQQPAFGPELIDFPVISPVLVENELQQPAFGPELIDFPLNSDGTVVGESPVVVGPIPQGASPLVQIIVNVANAGAGVVPGVVADIPHEIIRPSGPINPLPQEWLRH